MSIDVNALKNVAKDSAIQYGKNKANEALSDQEKFQQTLDKVAKSSGFKKVENIWNACEESDREKIYKAGQQKGKSTVEKIIDPLGLGIIDTTKQVDPTLATIQMLRYKNNNLKGLKALCPPQTFETTMRFLMQLGLLQRPKKITKEMFLEDLQSDTKSVNAKLIALEAVATVVPYLRPLLPLIQMLRTYVKKLGETAVQKLIAEQHQEYATTPQDGEEQVVKNTQEGTVMLGTTVQTEDIKEKVIKTLATQQQPGSVSQETSSSKKEDPALSKTTVAVTPGNLSDKDGARSPSGSESAIEKVVQ